VWQWIKHGATLQPGNKPLTEEGFEAALKDELAALREQVRFWSHVLRDFQHPLKVEQGTLGPDRLLSRRTAGQ